MKTIKREVIMGQDKNTEAFKCSGVREEVDGCTEKDL